MSAMLLSAIVSALHRAARGYVGAENSVGESTVYAADPAEVQRAMVEIETATRMTARRVNARETKAFGIGMGPGLRYDNRPLEWVSTVKILGAQLVFANVRPRFLMPEPKVEARAGVAERLR